MSLTKHLPYLVVFLVSVAVFSNSLYGEFCFDDAFALLYNGDVHNADNPIVPIFFHDFWGHDITKPDSHKSYRPFTTLSFRFNWLLFLWMGGNETKPAHLGEDAHGSTWQPPEFLLGLHLINVLLHGLTSCYVYKLGKDLFTYLRVFGKIKIENNEAGESHESSESTMNWLAFLGALLFATHPIHTEAVASIVGRAEILSAVLCLAGFDLWRHGSTFTHDLIAIALVYASVLCKEITFAMYGGFIVWDGLYHLEASIVESQEKSSRSRTNISTPQQSTNVPKAGKSAKESTQVSSVYSSSQKRIQPKYGSELIDKLPAWIPIFVRRTLLSAAFWKRIVPVLVCFMAYLKMRSTLMGNSMLVQNYRRVENPLAYIEEFKWKWLSIAHLHARYLWILVYPVYLSCDWSFNCIPLISSFNDFNVLFTALAYAAVVIPTLWSIHQIFKGNPIAPIILFCIFWGILFFMPASNIFFFVGTMLAERVLYLPSVPFCLMVPFVVYSLIKFLPLNTRHIIAISVCIIIVASYSQITYERNNDWIHNEALFVAAEKVCPESAKVHFNMGILRTQQKTWHKAAAHFKKTLEIEPNYCEVAYRRALMHLGQANFNAGVPDLHEALDCMYTRSDAAQALYKVYQSFIDHDPKNAQKYADAWNAVVRKLEPIIQMEKEGKIPVRQG